MSEYCIDAEYRKAFSTTLDHTLTEALRNRLRIVIVSGGSATLLNSVVGWLSRRFPRASLLVIRGPSQQLAVFPPPGAPTEIEAATGNEGQLLLRTTMIRTIYRFHPAAVLFLTHGDKPRLSDLLSFVLLHRNRFFVMELPYPNGHVTTAYRFQARIVFKVIEHVIDVILTLFGAAFLLGYALIIKLHKK